MTRKVKSLSVHRNTIERKRKRQVQADMIQAAKDIGQNDIRCYAVLAIDAEGRAYASWDTGGVMPMWAFPEVMGKVLAQDVECSGIADDWVPDLTRGRKP